MGKMLLMCEKPSVAQDFSKALSREGGNFQRKDGYLENGKYVITWAYGHLCELCEPHEYNENYKKWSISDLPIIPEQFRYRVIKTGKKQFETIKKLVNRKDIDTIVNCGDCGREGELIQRLILIQAGNKKPVKRFWTSKALTSDVILREIKNLRESNEFDSLYYSALARQWADWIVGINCTRAVTVKNSRLFSVGRVQTAVLSLIVQREQERKNFKPQDYYNIKSSFRLQRGNQYIGLYVNEKEKVEKTEIEDSEKGEESINSSYAVKTKKEAEEICRNTEGCKGTVVKKIEKQSKESPPRLFSLTTLQQEANRLFGFSSSKVLEIAQSLYEKHLISYPRTESQYINPEYFGEIKKILSNLVSASVVRFDLNKCKVNASDKRIFNAEKLTDHHAIIPQRVLGNQNLNEQERKILELIYKRFISAFYPDCIYKNTFIETEVKGKDGKNYTFITTGKKVVQKGWREIYGGLQEDIDIPEIEEGDKSKLEKTEIQEKQTKPPLRYTDASLLDVMANAHRYIKDEKMKNILKETAGIGTPATRAGIIQTLIDRKYVIKKGKTFIPTQKAEYLIENLKNEQVSRIDYTAIWEQSLDEIAKNNGSFNDVKRFLGNINDYVKDFIRRWDNKQKWQFNNVRSNIRKAQKEH